jgi:hypothetical protein
MNRKAVMRDQKPIFGLHPGAPVYDELLRTFVARGTEATSVMAAYPHASLPTPHLYWSLSSPRQSWVLSGASMSRPRENSGAN